MKAIEKLKQFAARQHTFDTFLFIATSGSMITLFKYQADAMDLPITFEIDSPEHKKLLKLAHKFKRTVHTEFVSTPFTLDNILT